MIKMYTLPLNYPCSGKHDHKKIHINITQRYDEYQYISKYLIKLFKVIKFYVGTVLIMTTSKSQKPDETFVYCSQSDKILAC